jgi:DNA mismatch repair ATPase MutS
MGYVKLADIALFLLGLYFSFQTLDIVVILFTFAVFEAYFLLIAIHHKAIYLMRENEEKRCIYQRYIDRLDGNWNAFYDTGNEFLDPKHGYSSDLDIFGENSLFQYLNTTKTWFGRQKFVNDLTELNLDLNSIKLRQQAIWELSNNIAFTVDMQTAGRRIKPDKNILEFISALKGYRTETAWKYGKYMVYLPVLSTIFMLVTFFFEIKILYIPAGILLMVHVILWVFSTLKLSHALSEIDGANYKFQEYSKIFKLMEDKSFSCELLRELKSKVSPSKGIKVSQAMEQLSHIVMKLDFRRNAVLYIVMNLFFLWDINCAYSIKTWRANFRERMDGWFESLGELESLLSFANLKFVDDDVCMPKFNDKKMIKAVDMGHPLIPKDKRVTNSFELNNEIFIVSGSNMSGKTTFLRTVGINMVLGLAGGFCCATELSIPVIGMITSMRIADDLSHGISTFYAELDRIKLALESSKDGQAIFLIDEIFKGTNSDDRLFGARSVIEKLDDYTSIGLITTHDLALCKTSQTQRPRIVNYSFAERYENDEMVFDYKIIKGQAKSTNARYLMNKLGITE